MHTAAETAMTQARLKLLGRAEYTEVFAEMRAFNDARDQASEDEIWLVEHPAVFTQGLAGKPEHLLALGDIPLIQTDRGGQVTYHGPGQIVVYPLLNLKRLRIGPRALVHGIEQVLIDYLAGFGIEALRRDAAPGVYVNQRKIASLGLRIRHGCSYHGLALNIDMDLEPFSRINPCGYAGLAMTQMREHVAAPPSLFEAGRALARGLASHFGLSLMEQTDRMHETNSPRTRSS